MNLYICYKLIRWPDDLNSFSMLARCSQRLGSMEKDSMKHLMKIDLTLLLKRSLMDMCTLLSLIYGARTWSLTEFQKLKLEGCQRETDRAGY